MGTLGHGDFDLLALALTQMITSIPHGVRLPFCRVMIWASIRSFERFIIDDGLHTGSRRQYHQDQLHASSITCEKAAAKATGGVGPEQLNTMPVRSILLSSSNKFLPA